MGEIIGSEYPFEEFLHLLDDDMEEKPANIRTDRL